jgi:hypothetical protein
MLAIGIALRAVLPGRVHTITMPHADIEVAHRLRVEHDAVLDVVEQIHTVADDLAADSGDRGAVRELLVPITARALGVEPTAGGKRLQPGPPGLPLNPARA